MIKHIKNQCKLCCLLHICIQTHISDKLDSCTLWKKSLLHNIFSFIFVSYINLNQLQLALTHLFRRFLKKSKFCSLYGTHDTGKIFLKFKLKWIIGMQNLILYKYYINANKSWYNGWPSKFLSLISNSLFVN